MQPLTVLLLIAALQINITACTTPRGPQGSDRADSPVAAEGATTLELLMFPDGSVWIGNEVVLVGGSSDDSVLRERILLAMWGTAGPSTKGAASRLERITLRVDQSTAFRHPQKVILLLEDLGAPDPEISFESEHALRSGLLDES